MRPKYSFLANLPKTIVFKDYSDNDIRHYYSFLNNLPEEERSGQNLLKNLKSIFTMANIFRIKMCKKIYSITNCDWQNSPVTQKIAGEVALQNKTISKYNYTTEMSNDPFIKMLYVDYPKTGTTRFYKNYDGKKKISFDKERAWSQSKSFKAENGAEGPAGTDLHNLIAGDSTVNRHYHTNYVFGTTKTIKKCCQERTDNGLDFYITGN